MLCLNSLNKALAVFCLLANETIVNTEQVKLIYNHNVLTNKKMEAKISTVINASELLFELQRK